MTMKRKHAWLFVIVVAVIVIGGFFVLRDRTERENNTAAKATPAKAAASNAATPAQQAAAVPKPKLFKSTRYPPVSPEEKAMWDWWHAMEKADPKFEWKMPIEFYGKVVDQTDAPVSGATIRYGWTTVVGPKPDPEAETVTGADGNFAITGIYGKRLVVQASKAGYDRTSNSMGSYEYAAFHEELFHVPDRNHPVIMVLHRITNAEPMLSFQIDRKVPLNSDPLVVDLASGQAKSDGDLAISVRAQPGVADYQPNYTIEINGLYGAGVVQTNEEFANFAPASGYSDGISIVQKSDDPGYERAKKFKLYARDQKGKFALVGMEDSVVGRRNEALLYISILRNVSGSQNLEFDQHKLINR
jgi:hypothetical protein